MTQTISYKKGNANLDFSGGSYIYVSGKTCLLAGTEDVHLGYKLQDWAEGQAATLGLEDCKENVDRDGGDDIR